MSIVHNTVPKASMEHIGKRIAQVRKHLGLNQIEFAKAYGVSQSAFKNYERGVADPPTKLIISICKQHDVSAEWLLLGIGYVDSSARKKTRQNALRTVISFLELEQIELPLESAVNLIDLIEEYYRSHSEPRHEMEQHLLNEFTQRIA